MNKSHKIILRRVVTAFAMILLLLAGEINSYASDSGYIRIVLKLYNPDTHRDEVVKGVEMQIYQIGTISDNLEEMEFYSEYGIADYPKDTEELEAVTDAITKKIKGKPAYAGITDAEGVVVFTNIPKGIYYIKSQSDSKDADFYAAPLIVRLPYYEKIDGDLVGPGYTVEIEPKLKRLPEDGGLDDKQTETESESNSDSSSYTEEETQSSSSPKGKSTTAGTNCPTIRRTQTRSGAKTGDTTNISLYIIIFAGSAAMILLVGLRKRRGEKQNDR